ncbi:phenylalanine--tRNA ligase subunit alpha [bacterium]|nr:phenylalanine--tRNA ligase subunit alpha [bacterium]
MINQDIESKIKNLESEFKKSIKTANDESEIESIRIQYLGRKGSISNLFKDLELFPLDERKQIGKKLNDLKSHIHTTLSKYQKTSQKKETSQQYLDPTLPGDRLPIGRYHPITTVLRKIISCFKSMGFSIAHGPEVETEYYNFEALNIPKGHPARDMQDTLFIDDNIVLRTHTSPVQIRVMENQPPPVRIIAPGRCYRRDTPDSTHSPVFYQVEGLCVDEGITFADMKGVISTFAKQLFGSQMKIRFRPSFFPFTEPSAEYDFTCMICEGKGCRVCKGTGWVEISGAGMVNPEVFKYVKYGSERYTGYAFGMGVERLAMLLYEVHDIRLFYENDVRFLNQF